MSTFDVVFPFILVLAIVLISALATWLCVRNKTNRLPEFQYKVNLPKEYRSDIEIAMSNIDSINNLYKQEIITEAKKYNERQKNADDTKHNINYFEFRRAIRRSFCRDTEQFN